MTEQQRAERYLTEIPSSLKQLARLVVRGFYTIEDSLIVDMLVRNPCKYTLNKKNFISTVKTFL